MNYRVHSLVDPKSSDCLEADARLGASHENDFDHDEIDGQ